MKKKIVSKVFAILLAACTVLSACGNESGNQSVGQTDKSETNDTVQEGEEPYTIVYAFDVWVQQADWDLVEENLSNIVYDKIGAKVKLLPMTGANYQQEVNLMITSGEKMCIRDSVATGICVDSALGAAKMLEEEGISAEVVNICTIKPLDEEIIINSAKKTGKVVTVEEHSVIGGLGSAVCDCLCANHPVPVKKVGMQDVFGESGSAAALVEKYGLDAKGVYKSVKEFL